MPFKFLVGQAVEYTPLGEKKAGLYKVVRQMPLEERASYFPDLVHADHPLEPFPANRREH